MEEEKNKIYFPNEIILPKEEKEIKEVEKPKTIIPKPEPEKVVNDPIIYKSVIQKSSNRKYYIVGMSLVILLLIFGVSFLVMGNNIIDKDFGTNVTISNNPVVPVETQNSYNHTFVNNIVINLDNETLMQIANSLVDEIKNQLNVTNSS